MSHQHVRLLQEIDQAKAKGDHEAFFDFLTDDVHLHFRGNNGLAGDYFGKNQVKGYWAKFLESMGTYTSANRAYFADDNVGVVLQKSHAEREGAAVDLEEVIIVHFGDSRVAAMWYVPADSPLIDAWIGH